MFLISTQNDPKITKRNLWKFHLVVLNITEVIKIFIKKVSH